ncbi:alanine:cation symporter family protein [Shigella boydii]
MAGVALAITAGGPGAVFWMWVAAFIGIGDLVRQCSLAQLYKERDANGSLWCTGTADGARAGDALDGRSVRRLFAHRLRQKFSAEFRRTPLREPGFF